MKKAYIQPEFDLLKLSSSEDVLTSPLEVSGTVGDSQNDWSDNDNGGTFDDWT